MGNTKKQSTKTNWNIIQTQLNDAWQKDYISILLDKRVVILGAVFTFALCQLFYGTVDGQIAKLASYISPVWFNNVISFAVYGIGLIAAAYYNHRIVELQYRPSFKVLVFTIAIALVYFATRFDQQWRFYTLWSSSIAYVDLLLIPIIGNAWAWYRFLTRKFEPNTNVRRNTDKYFKLDSHLDHEDELGRDKFAKEIAEYLHNSFGNRALAVGISGAWGTGKSYLLERIYSSIDERGYCDTILIRYNPWRSSSSKQIVKDFLNALKTEIGKYDRNLEDKFQKYLAALIKNSDSNWLKTIDKVLPTSSDMPVDQLYNEINASLKVLQKKVMIFIDDLDRLHKEEILEVFRLIRNTADFYNTCFVVAYDRGYVESAFHGTYSQMENYLDKIFQVEFTLPVVQPDTIWKQLVLEIDHRTEIPVDFIFTDEIQKKYKNLVTEIVENKRDVVRFTNNLRFDYGIINEEIDGIDFFLLSLLKYRFVSVYQLLFQQSSRDVLLSVEKTETDQPFYIIATKGISEFKATHSHLFEKFTEVQKATICKILKVLFSKPEKGVDSLCYIPNYYKYFTLSVDDSDIKHREFWNALKLEYAAFKETLAEWLKNRENHERLNILFSGFKIDVFDDIDSVRNYIYGLKKLSLRKANDDTINQLYHSLNSLGFNKDGLKVYFPKGTDSDLDEAVVDTIFPEGESDILNWLIIKQLYEDRVTDNSLYSKEKSRDLVLGRFNRLKGENDFRGLYEACLVLRSGAYIDEWSDEISTTTNELADLIMNNQTGYLEILKSKMIEEDRESDGNDVNLHDALKRNERSVSALVPAILANKFLHNHSGEIDSNIKEVKKRRIEFIRELVLEKVLHVGVLKDFIILIGPGIEAISYDSNIDYIKAIKEIYPKESSEHGDIDRMLWETLLREWDSRRDKRYNTNSSDHEN